MAALSLIKYRLCEEIVNNLSRLSFNGVIGDLKALSSWRRINDVGVFAY